MCRAPHKYSLWAPINKLICCLKFSTIGRKERLPCLFVAPSVRVYVPVGFRLHVFLFRSRNYLFMFPIVQWTVHRCFHISPWRGKGSIAAVAHVPWLFRTCWCWSNLELLGSAGPWHHELRTGYTITHDAANYPLSHMWTPATDCQTLLLCFVDHDHKFKPSPKYAGTCEW